jgi:predicted RNA binding protein YcfA (HicA-like mRNA interferase family)
MARQPVVSGAEAVKAFQRAGWRVDRQKGSHVVLLKPGHIASLSVPQHPSWRLARCGLRAAGLSVDDFKALL